MGEKFVKLIFQFRSSESKAFAYFIPIDEPLAI